MHSDMLCPSTYLPIGIMHHASPESSAVVSILQLTYPVILSNRFQETNMAYYRLSFETLKVR